MKIDRGPVQSSRSKQSRMQSRQIQLCIGNDVHTVLMVLSEDTGNVFTYFFVDGVTYCMVVISSWHQVNEPSVIGVRVDLGGFYCFRPPAHPLPPECRLGDHFRSTRLDCQRWIVCTVNGRLGPQWLHSECRCIYACIECFDCSNSLSQPSFTSLPGILTIEPNMLLRSLNACVSVCACVCNWDLVA